MIFRILFMSFLVGMLSGCSSVLGKLRQDFGDDSPAFSPAPTYGGMRAEGGVLQREEYPSSDYAYVGHSERLPASVNEYAASNQGSWVDQDARDEIHRMQRYASEQDVLPDVKRQYQDSARATAEDFIDKQQEAGSLWASNGQTNYFFVKNRIKGVGDIITLTLQGEIIRDIANEVKKTLTQQELDAEIMEYADMRRSPASMAANAANATAAADANGAAGTNKAQASAVELPTYQTLDIRQSLGVKEGEPLMVEIMERYPNGNYKVRGTKRVPYKGSTRLVSVVGIIKNEDISENDTVGSEKIYEYMVKAYR